MPAQFQRLLDKLDEFIKRHYLNRLLKGLLWFAGGFLILFLSFVSLEYVGYFEPRIRLVLFYTFIGFNLFVFVRFVIIPLAGLIRIGRRLGLDDAARILGQFFRHELGDQITNALQLKRFFDQNPEESDLILAAIEQKAERASHVPFSKAINLKGNYRYLPYVLIPAIVISGIFLIWPDYITEPASRIVRYESHFERPAPFRLEPTDTYRVFRGENLQMEIKATGLVVPAQADIVYPQGQFRMNAEKSGLFTHQIRNIQQGFHFYLLSEGFRFGPYEVEVVQKPVFRHFTLQVQPPAYTRLENEQFQNMGDIRVPVGSRLIWEFNTGGTGEAEMHIDDIFQERELERAGVYRFQKQALNTFDYHVFASNQEAGRGDSLSYTVQIIEDAWPHIDVEAYQDSVMIAFLFHRGLIQDDYGFDKLEFHFRRFPQFTGRGAATNEFEIHPVNITAGLNNQVFYHHIDTRDLSLQPGETLEYFFVVYDNDRINGSKHTRSRGFSFSVPSREEMLAERRQQSEQINQELSTGMSQARQAREEINRIRREMLQQERLGWEQQESIQELLNRQQEMEERLENLAEKKHESDLRQQQYEESSERIREKQEEIQRIFDEVMPDELKELMEQIRQELDKLNREQVFEMLDRMQFEMQQLENQMDRALELFRQLEMERLLQESIDRLAELSEKQQDLADETSQQGSDEQFDQWQEQQEELNREFEAIKEQMDEFREKNENLKNPRNIDDTGTLEESIKNFMENAAESLKQQEGNKAKQQQNNARQSMQELSQRMEGMSMDMMMDQLAEDARVLRQILENLLKTSFAQEDLMGEIRGVNVNDPRFVQLIQDQRKIRDDLTMIEDSLVALAKRQAAIEGFVMREIGEIHMNIDRAIDDLINRRRAQGASRQQFTMTHINNLALMLNESLQNMQMQMAMSQGMGENMQPGQGQPSFQNMRQMQEQLNQMLQQMQQGHTPMPGESGKPGMTESEALARMAAEQEAIRRELQRMADERRRDGLGESQELLELQREMERTELDIVRRNINRQTINRQERILTRLLEHEKAELMREQEERREGTTARRWDLSNPDSFFEYNRIRNREVDMLRKIPPGLMPYYRSLVESYFLNVE